MKIAIALSQWSKSKRVFRAVEKQIIELKPKVIHSADYYSLELDDFKLYAIPLTEKLCGWRFDRIITDRAAASDDRIMETIIAPMFAAQQVESTIEYERLTIIEDDLFAESHNWRDSYDGCYGNM